MNFIKSMRDFINPYKEIRRLNAHYDEHEKLVTSLYDQNNELRKKLKNFEVIVSDCPRCNCLLVLNKSGK